VGNMCLRKYLITWGEKQKKGYKHHRSTPKRTNFDQRKQCLGQNKSNNTTSIIIKIPIVVYKPKRVWEKKKKKWRQELGRQKKMDGM